jgi:hypothetical protein
MKSFEKQMSSRIGLKPIFKSSTVLKFTIPCNQIIKLDFLKPVYQSDLNETNITEMVESIRFNPEYFLLRAVLACAVYRDKMYLMDGQHRLEMMKRIDVPYPCELLCYQIKNNDEMRQLFRELNKDSYKNMAYISLPHETACLIDELIEHYSPMGYFTKTKSESKLFTSRAFFELLSDYLALFQTSKEAIFDIEQKQATFMSTLIMKTNYVEESKCIKSKFIMPLKNCNFISFLNDPAIIPTYTGKGTNAVDKGLVNPNLKTIRTAVWNHHIGMDKGVSICMVCKVFPIYQMDFHCGHVLAKSKGGLNTLENLRPICQSCNLSMGAIHMDDFMKIIPQKNLNASS